MPPVLFVLVPIFSKFLFSLVRGNFLPFAFASAGHYLVLLVRFRHRLSLSKSTWSSNKPAGADRKRRSASIKRGGQPPSSSNQLTPEIEAKKVIWRLA